VRADNIGFVILNEFADSEKISQLRFFLKWDIKDFKAPSARFGIELAILRVG